MTLSADMYLVPADLADFLPDVAATKLSSMILDVFAEMVSEAPSIDPEADVTLSNAQRALVTSILRQAVVEYHHSAGGTMSSEQKTAGPFTVTTSVDTRRGRSFLARSQITRLHALEDALSDAKRRVGLVEADQLAEWSVGRAPAELWASL